MTELAIIAAMDRNRVIGKDNQLPWHLPNDLKHFKALTTGHPVLMGRKTYESIGRPLPRRRNLVLTRQADYHPEGVEVVHSLEKALKRTADHPLVFVIGGEGVYKSCLNRADRIYLTEVDTEVGGGDAFFPDWEEHLFDEVSRNDHAADEHHPFAYSFVEYVPKHHTR